MSALDDLLVKEIVMPLRTTGGMVRTDKLKEVIKRLMMDIAKETTTNHKLFKRIEEL